MENWKDYYKGKSVDKIQQNLKSLNEKIQKIMNQQVLNILLRKIPQELKPRGTLKIMIEPKEL